MATFDIGAGVAVGGLAVWELHKAYRDMAPSLPDLRNAVDSPIHTNALMDADISVGSISFLAGASVSILTKRWEPMILVLLAFVVTSLYYHMVLNTRG